MGELVTGLDPFPLFNGLRWVTFLDGPISGESRLFLSLNFDFNKVRKQLLENLNENFAVDKIARLVEGKLSLDLNPSLRKIAAGIAEVEHLLDSLHKICPFYL